MLKLDMKAVCKLAQIGRRTLTEFEAGGRNLSSSTAVKLEAFYISKGIYFSNNDLDEYVKFSASSNISEIVEDVVLDKVEYLDILKIYECTEVLYNIKEGLEKLDIKTDFSKESLLRELRTRGGNQKEMAILLECSPAFISAIVTGKKKMSATISRNLNKITNNNLFDLDFAYLAERKIKSSIKSAVLAIESIEAEIELINRLLKKALPNGVLS